MKSELVQLFNKQINNEFYSAFLYLSMAEWLSQEGFSGAAHWMAAQYAEELNHAEGLYRYLQRNGAPIELDGVAKPKAKWSSILECFEEALEHEKTITASLNKIVAKAREVGNYAADHFLDWYVMEQVEEEDTQRDNVDVLRRAQDNPAALYAFDQSLATRSFSKTTIPYTD